MQDATIALECTHIRTAIKAWQQSLHPDLDQVKKRAASGSSLSSFAQSDETPGSPNLALRRLLSTLAAGSIPESLCAEIENVFTIGVELSHLVPTAVTKVGGEKYSSGCPFAKAVTTQLPLPLPELDATSTAADEEERPSPSDDPDIQLPCSLKRMDSSSSCLEHFSETDAAALFNMFGGWEGLAAGVSCMYLRLMEDPRTSHFFEGVNYQHLVKHMTIVIGNSLLGNRIFDHDSLRRQHSRCRRMGLTTVHLSVMCEHLEAGLLSVGCPAKTIQAALKVVLSYKDVFMPSSSSVSSSVEGPTEQCEQACA